MKIGIRKKILFYNFILFFVFGSIIYFFAHQEIKKSTTNEIEKKLNSSTILLTNLLDNYILEKIEGLDKALNLVSEAELLENSIVFSEFEGIVLFDSAFSVIQTSGKGVSSQNIEVIKSHAERHSANSIKVHISEDKKNFNILRKNEDNNTCLLAILPVELIYNELEQASKNMRLNSHLGIDIFDDKRQTYYSNYAFNSPEKSRYFYQQIVDQFYSPDKTFDEHFFIDNDRVYFVSGNIIQEKLSNTWFLALSLPEVEVYSPLLLLNKNILYVLLLIIIPAIVLSILMANFFIKPLLKLKKVTTDYGNGIFDSKASFKSKDEFYELSLVMSDMAEQLSNRINIQEELNIELNTHLELVKTQKNEIQLKSNLIEDSINYASLIQSSLLPLNENYESKGIKIHKYFKPLRVVSGDFYFIETVKVGGKEYLITVLIDCTGHGVSGAFMTIIAHNLLSQIISTRRNVSPTAILEYLDKGLTKTLKQEGENVLIKDGMEAIVTVFDFENNRFYYSSSFLSLIHLSGTEMFFHKGQKKVIGYNAFIDKDSPPFESYSINLKEGDSIVLYTDGLVDQYGGDQPRKRKLSTKRLRQILQDKIETESENPKIGLFLEDKIETWKAGMEQLDDITFLVIEKTKAFEAPDQIQTTENSFLKTNFIKSYSNNQNRSTPG